MYMGIPHVHRVKFTSLRFLNQISRVPVPHWIQNPAASYIYIYIHMLAFCCGDPTLRTSQMLTYIIPTFDGIYFVAIVDRSAGSVLYPKALKQGFVCSQNLRLIYIYIYTYVFLIFFVIYVYFNCMQYLSNYLNVHMKTILVTDNHLEHQGFQIVQSLTLEPPSGEFPSTHRRIPVRHIWSGTAWEDQQRCVYMRCARIAKQRHQH